MRPLPIITTALFFLLAACQRGPRTAAELYDHLPRKFQGALHVKGETTARTLTVEVRDLNVRDPHLLEFKNLGYRISGGDEGSSEGESAVTGTISAPGGEIRIEDVPGGAAQDALRPGSFRGTLSRDLQNVDASWMTSYGQSVKFSGQAAR